MWPWLEQPYQKSNINVDAFWCSRGWLLKNLALDTGNMFTPSTRHLPVFFTPFLFFFFCEEKTHNKSSAKKRPNWASKTSWHREDVFSWHVFGCLRMSFSLALPSGKLTWELDNEPFEDVYTLQGTNISPKNGILKMIFLFPRWDMLIPWRVFLIDPLLC